ncbi:MAG TPA: phage tail protein [Longimicrobiaceae bacterium]|nr:phage tail protein [Longimicrobiaceae bacterium]
MDDDRKLAGSFNFVVTLRRSAAAASGASEVGDATLPVTDPIGPGDEPGDDDSPGHLLCDAGFQDCSGLEVEMDVTELVEGGRNDGVIRRVGRGKYGNIVLKRGMFYGRGDRVNPDLWLWLQGILAGKRPVRRYDGLIQMLAADGVTVRASWQFDRGLPAKIAGPHLDAKTGDVAVEELTIAHEGLRLAI